MALFDSQVSLYDLLLPSMGASAAQPPPQDQMGSSNAADLWGSPVQPSRTDLFLDNAIGSDRYGDLGDEARRRALDQAISSIGQSLMQAAFSPSYTALGKTLGGAIPGALGAFEKGLASEQELFDKQEDRQYTREQREYQKGQQGRVLKDQESEDKARQVRNEAAPSVLEDAKNFLNSVQVDKYDDPGKVEAAKADLKRIIMEVERTIKIGGNVGTDQYKALESARDRLAQATGTYESIRAEAAVGILKEAEKAGVSPEEYIKRGHELFGFDLAKAKADLERAKIQNENARMDLEREKEQKALLDSLSPEERKAVMMGGQGAAGGAPVFIQKPSGEWVLNPMLQRPPSSTSVENRAQDALRVLAEDPGVNQILSTPDQKAWVVQSPETVAALQGVGIYVTIGQTIDPQTRSKIEEIRRLTNFLTPRGVSPAPSSTSVPTNVVALYEKAKKRRPVPFTGTLEEFYAQYQQSTGAQ